MGMSIQHRLPPIDCHPSALMLGTPHTAAMFHLWEPLRCSPRPLAFYLVTELFSLWSHLIMTLVLGYRWIMGSACIPHLHSTPVFRQRIFPFTIIHCRTAIELYPITCHLTAYWPFNFILSRGTTSWESWENLLSVG